MTNSAFRSSYILLIHFEFYVFFSLVSHIAKVCKFLFSTYVSIDFTSENSHISLPHITPVYNINSFSLFKLRSTSDW